MCLITYELVKLESRRDDYSRSQEREWKEKDSLSFLTKLVQKKVFNTQKFEIFKKCLSVIAMQIRLLIMTSGL